MIRSTFLRIDRDSPPRLQADGTYPYALNAKRDTESNYSGGLTNELRNILRKHIPGKTVGYHRLEERNSTLFFHIDGGSSISIWNHDTNELTPVVKDTDFGCTWNFDECKWMGYGHSISKTLAPCNDLIVYWSSGMYYYKANIDELLDPERRSSISKLDEPCEHFKLIRCISGPIVRIRPLRGGGKDLPPGQYFTVARFLDESGNSSNWTAIEGPAYIGSKYNKFTDYSRQSLQIEVKNLAKSYSRIEIAVIPPIGSQAQDVAYVIYDGSYNTNGVTCQYYSSSQHKKIISLAEIFAKDIKFIRGCNIFQHEGKAHLYRTVQEFNPKVQQWAQKAVVSFISYAVPASKAHLFKGLPRDEVIALGEQRKYCDGFYTAVGHYPGPSAGDNDLVCGCELPRGNTGNNSALLEEYVKFSGEGETLCLIGGQQVTINEGFNPIRPCEEPMIEPRSDDENSCVHHETDSEAVKTDIDNLQTVPESLDDCIECAEETSKNDLKQGSNFVTQFLEHTTDLFRTDKDVAADCTTGKHTTIIGAAKTLFTTAVRGAEKNEEIKFRTVVKKSVPGENLARENVNSVQFFGVAEDCLTDEVEPIVLAKYKPGGYESTIPYPKTLDCDGQPLYGDLAGLPQRFFRTPSTNLVPLTITVQSGVESRFDPSNVPGKDTYVVFIGIQVDNVYIPSYDQKEIPKPLDENEPFRIVMAERERHNQTKVFSGYATPTFKGKQGNKEYAVPRHAASSYPNVDRSIDDDGSHLGEDWDVPIYNLHSPDIHNASEFVTFDYITVEGILTGDGMVYGHYVEGKRVKDEDNRQDRRGVRSALNLTWNQELSESQFKTCVLGAEFAEHNTNLQNPEGIDYPLLNKYRESSIVFQTAEPLPPINLAGYSVNSKDWSFNVGGLDHEYPTRGVAWYVTAHRFNTQMYGSIESLQYMDIGLLGKAGQTSVRGLVGDTFVQKWSDKRTSYVSDKVGNILNVDFPVTAADAFLGPAGTVGRDRGVCDPPNRVGLRMKEWLGFFYPQELPENGDKKDPKNMANGHPTLFANQIQGIKLQADTDLFFPRTLAHLNHLFVESDTNLYFRSTSTPETREVFYENLQGLDVDSSINKVDPDQAWLNDWHNEQLQPSKKQKEKKARIRFLIGIVFPLILMGGIAGIPTSLSLGLTALMGSGFLIMYLLLVRNILSGKKLDKLLGIPECKTDDEGAQDENNTRDLKDNWNDYNWGFSAVNDLNFFIGMPSNYNTCVCENLSNVIRSSNRQIHTSPYDAYMNFQGLSYTGIPAESGLLQNIFTWENGVYAQTTDGTLVLRAKEGNLNGAVGQLLGGSAWVENPYKIGDGIFEGYGGTVDPNAGIICRSGYVSLDYEAKEITIFNGGFKSIVGRGSGLYKYWQDSFSFCNSGCRDQMNPSGTHFTFGYDPEYELLLITKKDNSGGFTWSYHLPTASYISEHSYVPDFYFWDRHKLYSVKDGDIYEHNKDGAYTTYFGEEKPFIVDVISANKGETFSYQNSVLDTEVNYLNKGDKPDLFDREETLGYLTVRNQYQQTGRLPIVNEDQNDAFSSIHNDLEIRVSRRNTGKWQFNAVRSNEHDRDDNIILLSDCGKVENFNQDNISVDTAQKTKEFRGKFLHHRFEFDKNDKQIILFGLDTFTDSEPKKPT